MAAQVIPLLSRIRAQVSRDWSQREIAEFYRVESALVQAGLELESERGMSDEGDPWFCFCRADTGEVFIHFARVDGRYVVDGGPFGAAARGDDFSELVRELIARHPLAATRRSGSNVFLHPAALLIALVGACFFHSGQAKAAETAEAHAARAADAHRRQGPTLAAGQAPPAGVDAPPAFTVTLDAAQTAAILTGVLIGLRGAAPAAAAAREVGPGSDGVATLFAAPRAAEVDPSHLATAIAAPESRAVLAVVAVLHDLFRLQAAPAPPAAGAAPAAAVSAASAPLPVATSPDGAAAAAPPAVAAGAPPALERPVVVVHLTAAALPHVEAVALLDATGVLKLIGDEHLDSLDRLPAFLADAIAHGEHVQVVAASGVADDGAFAPADPTTALTAGHAAVAPEGAVRETPSAGGGEPPTPPHSTADPTPDPVVIPAPTPPVAADPTPPVATHDATPATPTPPAADPPPPPQAAQTPPAPAPAPTPAPAPPAPAPDPVPAVSGDVVMHGHSATLDAAVLKFTAAVHAGILVSGSEVVLYDPQILQPLAPGQHLDSITFHFDDGSSISLVGTTSSLHDLHGVT